MKEETKTYTADKLQTEDTGQNFFLLVKDRIINFAIEILYEPLIPGGLLVNETSIKTRLQNLLEETVKERFGEGKFKLYIPLINIEEIDAVKGEFRIIMRRKEDLSIIENNIEFNDYLMEGYEEVLGAKFAITPKKEGEDLKEN
jgi:hypothetical protein